MAFDKTYVLMTLEDQYGRQSSKRVQLVTDDAAQAEIDAGLVAAAYSAAMGGIVRKWTLQGVYEFAGPAAPGNIDTGVTIRAQLDGRSDKAATKWPMPLSDYLQAGGTVDVDDALVQAIEGLYQSPGNIALLSDGEAITEFISGTLDK